MVQCSVGCLGGLEGKSREPHEDRAVLRVLADPGGGLPLPFPSSFPSSVLREEKVGNLVSEHLETLDVHRPGESHQLVHVRGGRVQAGEQTEESVPE